MNLLPVSSKSIGTPRKCLSLKSYKEINSNVIIIPIESEREIKLPLPKLNLKDTPNEFLRIQNRLSKFQFILHLKNGRVWGANGAIITNDDTFLTDLSREFGLKNICKDHSIFHTLFLKKAIFSNANVAVITTSGADVYYHWMLDILPRILLLKIANIFDRIDFFIIKYNGLKFQEQTLKILGVPEEKIINSSDNWKFHLHAKNLYVPSLLSNLNEVNKFEIDLLKKYFISHATPVQLREKIYISRKKINTRSIENESIITEYLENSGFYIIELESLSVPQQISLFQHARIIIGPHGSGFTNIIFSKPGTILIDILPSSNIVPCFYNIASQIGLKYYGFIGQSIPIDNNRKSDKIKIDSQEFFSFVECVISKEMREVF